MWLSSPASGDRSHGEKPDYVTGLVEVLRKTFKQGGNVRDLQWEEHRKCSTSLERLKNEVRPPELRDLRYYVNDHAGNQYF